MKLETRGTLFSVLGAATMVTLLTFLVSRIHVTKPILPWILHNAELLGVGGWILLLLTAAVRRLDPTELPRPFNKVPWDGRRWEFFVFGAYGVLLMMFFLIVIVCAGVILPIVVPFKYLHLYVLGPSATLYSAFLSFPVVFLTTSVAFWIVYVLLIDYDKGNLVRAGRPLNTGAPGEGWSPLEVFYFSLSTMVKGATQYEASGWCRWFALLEVLVARLLELAVVTVGFAIIIRHTIR